MAKNTKILKTCSKGHSFYKTSECPACPVCEKENKRAKGFLSLIAAPARRALENKGILTLKQLANTTESALLQLHGMGKTTIPILHKALKEKDLHFKKEPPMAKAVKLSDAEEVTVHIQKLDPAIAKTVEAIRQIILSSGKEIAERIKWNNPSFYYSGEMKAFDPKEYKREIIVFNLYKGRIMLVFPSGAKVNDTSGLLEGHYKDGRRITIFKDMADVKSKEKTLKKVIKDWLKLADQ